MAWQNLPLSLTLLCAALYLEQVIAPNLVAQAQGTKTTAVWVSFTPPLGRGIPTNRMGAATRSLMCPEDKPSQDERFISLIPDYSETDSERPSFTVYIPPTVAQKAFFSLRDANEDYSYQAEISLPETSGTYRLQLPADAPSIVPNKKYQWFLSLRCGKAINPSDPIIGGVIQFVKSDTN